MPEPQEPLAGAAEAVGEPLDDAVLYGPMEGMPEKPPEAEGQTEMIPDQEAQPPSDETPEGGPAPAPAPEEPPEPAADPAPAPAPAPAADEPEDVDLYAWDKDRQNADQEHANERKAWEAEKTALQAQIAAVGKDARRDAPDEADSTAAKTLKALRDAASEMNADSTADDYAEVLKHMPDALDAAAELGATKATKALESRLTELQAQLQQTEEHRQAADVDQAQSKVNAEHNSMLRALDQKHGGHIRSLANKDVAAELAAQGYDNENRADAFTLELLFTKHYERLAKKHPRKAPPPKPKGSVPRGAPGTGGAAVPQIKTGSREDVAKQMLANGDFS